MQGATPSRQSSAIAAGVDHRDMANAIRALAMDAVEKANSGHPGMPMGMADVATVLFGQFLKFDPADPHWPDRDRFVLSAGHGSMLLYALLYLTGYPDMTLDEIKRFRQLGSRTAGHPEYGHAAGIETTTGPLGQGLANAVGMAMAERLLNARFGNDLVDHHTYVIAGDGCLMEGISHEAISLAGHLKLNKLIVLFDDNSISIDGADLAVGVRRPAGALHRQRLATSSASTAMTPPPSPPRWPGRRAATSPALIACRTVIGYGAPNKAGTSATHGSPLGAEEVAGAREKLGWTHAPFDIPDEILSAWRAFGARGAGARAAWKGRHVQAQGPRRIRPPHRRRPAGGIRGRRRRAEAGDIGRSAEDRHAAILAEGAGRPGAGAAGTDRRLGRSHRLEQHQGQGHGRRSPPATMPAATSITACASTAWPRR